MTNWPTAPLIRIKRGLKIQEEIRDELAIRNTNGSYMTQKHTLYSTGAYNVIDEWEEVTAIPTAALEEFKEAWKGFGMYDPDDSQRVTDAITSILSYLPADKPSALDRAVTRVKDIGGPMIDAETLPADRLSLLLDALASVQSARNKTSPLAMVARICFDWANVEDKRGDSLEVARRRVEVLSNSGDFIVLSALVGDVTTALCENFSPRHDLIDAGAYALAWAAQIIEEEDK